MSPTLAQIDAMARQAVHAGDWSRVTHLATEIARQAPSDPNGPFLMGLVQKAARRSEAAADYFAKALAMNPIRFDAAIELANQSVLLNRFDQALSLLSQNVEAAAASAYYLDLAGQAYFAMNLYDDAWKLYRHASDLQPGNDSIQEHMAACAVFLGKLDIAKKVYRGLLQRHPRHQKIHFELSQLDRAKNDRHIRQMLKVLNKSGENPANSIFLYYAIGKEYEDLGRWDDAFGYFEKGGRAVKSVTEYNVADDVDIVQAIIDTCTATWLKQKNATVVNEKTPIFIVGLPRTGTTLTDRILSCHSDVQSAGESQLLQMVLRNGRSAGNQIGITKDLLATAAARKPADIASAYCSAIKHRLGPEKFFIEKLPENVLYLGFIAKAWPDARIIHLRRHPMDACFAMFKQSYFRFAYTLDDLAEYYLAYDRLTRHWRNVLDDRVVELQYENLVANFDAEIHQLFDDIDIEFQSACLNFDQSTAPVATASSVQVREKVHARSVAKWKKFERHLEPLRSQLASAGVELEA